MGSAARGFAYIDVFENGAKGLLAEGAAPLFGFLNAIDLDTPVGELEMGKHLKRGRDIGGVVGDLAKEALMPQGIDCPTIGL